MYTTLTSASAPPSVQFGELKAPPEAVGAERLRSLSWVRVERAEDSGEGAAEWIDEQRGRSPRFVGIRTAPTPRTQCL
jgi:hypothetical protein